MNVNGLQQVGSHLSSWYVGCKRSNKSRLSKSATKRKKCFIRLSLMKMYGDSPSTGLTSSVAVILSSLFFFLPCKYELHFLDCPTQTSCPSTLFTIEFFSAYSDPVGRKRWDCVRASGTTFFVGRWLDPSQRPNEHLYSHTQRICKQDEVLVVVQGTRE